MSGGRRLRVVHAVPDLEYGGLQRLVVDFAGRTDPERFEVHTLVFGQVGPLADLIPHPGSLHRVVPQPRWSMLWPQRVTAQLRALSPDVLHSHSGVWYKASLAARHAGVKWIVHTDHGRQVPDPWQARLVDGLASRRTDVIVAVSEPLAEQLRRRVVAFPERVRVVNNGVDTERHRPASGAADLRAELGIPGQAVVFGSVGRLERIKGYDIILEAFARLHAGLPDPGDAVLLVAGDGAERSVLEARVRELRLDGAVRFPGWRSDLARLHATFDVFTLTSRSEGTSVSLLEAMSAGLCPVVTDVGGNSHVLGPELRHRLVPPGDVESIASAWAETIRDPARRAADGAAARRRVEEHFSLRAMVRAYEEIYLEGAGGRR